MRSLVLIPFLLTQPLLGCSANNDEPSDLDLVTEETTVSPAATVPGEQPSGSTDTGTTTTTPGTDPNTSEPPAPNGLTVPYPAGIPTGYAGGALSATNAGDDTERELHLVAAAAQLRYACDINGTTIHLEYGYHEVSGSNIDLSFYPLKTDCTDVANSGLETDPNDGCVFFKVNTGRVEINFDFAIQGAKSFPATYVGRLTSDSNCNNTSALATGMSSALCKADYTCTAEAVSPASAATSDSRDANFIKFQASQLSYYACEVNGTGFDLGTVYFIPDTEIPEGFLGASSSPYFFSPVGKSGEDSSTSNCTDSTLIGAGFADSNQHCVFYASTLGRWSLNVNTNAADVGLPESVNSVIANGSDCSIPSNLQAGVTPAMCSAAYTCTRNNLP